MRWFDDLLGRRPRVRIALAPTEPMLHIAEQCQSALRLCLEPATQRRHEGVAYLLGRTDGTTGLCVHAVRPRATTTPGSFNVEPREMALVVQTACDLDLQIVAQVHTHPRGAAHSDGDEDGANIRYDGFFSIVVPDYGIHLPDLSGAATYHYSAASGWTLLRGDRLRVVTPGTALDG